MDFIDTALLTSWVILIFLVMGFGFYGWLQEKGFIKSEVPKLLIYSMGITFISAVIVTAINFFHPIKSIFYVMNGADNYESIFINNKVHGISPNSYSKLTVRGKSYSVLSSNSGINETVESGVYIVNLSDNKKVDFERVLYLPEQYARSLSEVFNERGLGHRDTPRGQGVYLVTEDLDDDVYAFDEYAPSSRREKDKGKVYQLKYFD